MTDTLELLAGELLALDNARPRSQQITPGASQAGSCRAALLLRTTGAEVTDQRLNLATLWGTSIHSTCENAADLDVMTERAFTYRGVPCTIDRYDPARQTLTDLKSKASPEKIHDIRQAGPSEANVWQIMLGAAALIEAGHDVKTVELLYLPRSGGTADDCWLWSAAFDQTTADQAADWMETERFRAENFASPATADDLHGLRDEPFFFCAAACPYFSLCRGAEAMPSDDDYADAASRFMAAKKAEAAAKEAKRDAAADLAGFAGNAGGLTVRQVQASESYVLDTDAIRAQEDLWQMFTGQPLPTKPSVRSGYVTVSKARGQAAAEFLAGQGL